LNIITKLWENHLVSRKEGFPDILYIDRMLMHEVTSAQAFDTLNKKNISIRSPKSIIATVDHTVSTCPSNRSVFINEEAKKQVDTLKLNIKNHNIDFYDINDKNQGIVHVSGPDLGFIWPGMTIVCGDSHTSTHGAFGCLAFGIGTSEVGHVLATNSLLQSSPKTMKVHFHGIPSKYISAKDIIMKLIADIGIGGASGHIIEYTGKVIKNMSMESRMTICNMSIECGARAGVIAPDQKTYNYLKNKKYSPNKKDWNKLITKWDALKSPTNALYDKEIHIDITSLEPMVTWGINPQHAVQVIGKTPKLSTIVTDELNLAIKAYNYTNLEEDIQMSTIKVDWAFVGSCTNGRIEDLRQVAKVINGKKVAKGVTMYIVPGSKSVRDQAIKEGLDKIFIRSGAIFRMPGCSMCLAMNADKVPAGKHCISTSNRNFIGRQGAGSITHLASPETVAASAILGKISTYQMLKEQYEKF
jgi:3-isopropylmalate/(R)-2-methylmalate dehydratase large subunit